MWIWTFFGGLFPRNSGHWLNNLTQSWVIAFAADKRDRGAFPGANLWHFSTKVC